MKSCSILVLNSHHRVTSLLRIKCLLLFSCNLSRGVDLCPPRRKFLAFLLENRRNNPNHNVRLFRGNFRIGIMRSCSILLVRIHGGSRNRGWLKRKILSYNSS